MVSQVRSRSERRVEKKQALVLLFLVLAVSLVSFALGVMVGKVNSGPETAQASPPEPARVAVPAALPEPPPAKEEVAPAPDHLTFFDTLPKGEQSPLGSGINLPPPRETKPEPEPVRTSPPEPRAAQERTASAPVAAAPKPAAAQTTPAPAPPPRPAVSPHGAFVIQVASFQDHDDARKLRDRLSSRGYAASTEQADLGSKGTWHRVVVGPYDSDQTASAAASRLNAEEKLSTMVRRR